jgi:hypothetical protein
MAVSVTAARLKFTEMKLACAERMRRERLEELQNAVSRLEAADAAEAKRVADAKASEDEAVTSKLGLVAIDIQPAERVRVARQEFKKNNKGEAAQNINLEDLFEVLKNKVCTVRKISVIQTDRINSAETEMKRVADSNAAQAKAAKEAERVDADVVTAAEPARVEAEGWRMSVRLLRPRPYALKAEPRRWRMSVRLLRPRRARLRARRITKRQRSACTWLKKRLRRRGC